MRAERAAAVRARVIGATQRLPADRAIPPRVLGAIEAFALGELPECAPQRREGRLDMAVGQRARGQACRRVVPARIT